jgi:uncharacterized protein (DUF1778 family)
VEALHRHLFRGQHVVDLAPLRLGLDRSVIVDGVPAGMADEAERRTFHAVMTFALRCAMMLARRSFHDDQSPYRPFRVKTADRNLIDRAARLLGKSRTDFMVESARQAAQDALLDQTLFKVNPKIRAAFVARLDAPPAPNEKLRRMMTAPAPWNE